MTDDVGASIPSPATGSSVRRVAARLTSGALFSKGLGFVREILVAHVIGVAALADSFRSATTIIFVPMVFLQNESVPAILIPRMRDAQEEGRAPQLLAAMTAALTAIAVLLMVATIVGATLLVDAMLDGLSLEERETTVQFVYIMAFSMPASVMINSLAAGEIVLAKTRLTNARASILNVGVMLGVGMLVLTDQAITLALAFTLSFNLLAAWAIFVLWREGNLAFNDLSFSSIWFETRLFARRLLPFMPLPAVEQANIWIERLLASRLTTGVIASLGYARTLTESSLLLVAQPIGLAVLSHGGGTNVDEQAKTLTRFVLILMMPASAYMYVFAPDIISLVFKRGAFGDTGVLLTSQALSGISVGIWASTLGWILLRLLNGSKRNMLAAGILVAAYSVNLLVNIATANLQQTTDNGIFLLGLGETARGLVLCFAGILAMNVRLHLFGIVAVSLLPGAAMTAIAYWIVANVDGVFIRLLVGGLGYGASVLFATALLSPGFYSKIYRAVSSRKGNTPDA
ncbi:lipid II flippase MurJ [Rhizobium sp. PAMB 3182]